MQLILIFETILVNHFVAFDTRLFAVWKTNLNDAPNEKCCEFVIILRKQIAGCCANENNAK